METFSSIEVTELPYVFSHPRFETYLRSKNGDVQSALTLYRWNLEVSAAFFVPLQVCEIAIRNGVADALEQVHGPRWPWSVGFRKSLPGHRQGYQPLRDLQSSSSRATTTGQVIAALKFMFWQSLFTVGQDTRLWMHQIHKVFPGIPPSTAPSAARATAYADIEAIRKLRNRIAHHEPIFGRDIANEYARIHNVISWRSQVAANWMDRTQQVVAISRRRP